MLMKLKNLIPYYLKILLAQTQGNLKRVVELEKEEAAESANLR